MDPEFPDFGISDSQLNAELDLLEDPAPFLDDDVNFDSPVKRPREDDDEARNNKRQRKVSFFFII